MKAPRTPWWAWTWPLLAWAILLSTPFVGTGGLVAAAAGASLIATVFAAVYHAEVVAHRTGEPFGTLVLAVAVTVIEVALIVSVMVAAPAEKAGLARDTVFAAVMIVCNGIVGLCLLWGGARHHEQGFQLYGASAALAVLAALTTLTLVLPNVATTAPGPVFSTSQLVFAGIVSLVLYGSFVFIQTIRHRDYFLPLEPDDEDAHAPPPSNTTTAVSAGLLLVALVAVVGLAKALTPMLEIGIARRGAEGRGGDRNCVVGVAAGSPGGAAGGAGQPVADQLEPGIGLGACQHRPDDSRGRCRVDRAPPAARAWAGRKGHGLAGADAPLERGHARDRPHHRAPGHRPPGRLRSVLVLRHRTVGDGTRLPFARRNSALRDCRLMQQCPPSQAGKADGIR
jgi:hypothetical protein